MNQSEFPSTPQNHPQSPVEIPAKQRTTVDHNSHLDNRKPPVVPRGTYSVKEKIYQGFFWLWLLSLLIVVILAIVFITQNSEHVQIIFLGWHTYPPLSVALIIALLFGAAIVSIIASWRLWHLHRSLNKLARG